MNFTTEYNQKELEEFLESHPKGHFMQSFMWTKVKDNWQHEFVVAYDDKKIVGAMLILIRKMPIFKTTLMYAPRGPVCDIHNREVFEGLINKTKELAKKYKTYALKIDPDVLISDTEFENMVNTAAEKADELKKQIKKTKEKIRVLEIYDKNGEMRGSIAFEDEIEHISVNGGYIGVAHSDVLDIVKSNGKIKKSFELASPIKFAMPFPAGNAAMIFAGGNTTIVR